MDTPSTPSTHRNGNNLKRTTKNLAANISEKITSFFGVRKRCSESDELQSGPKRRRSNAKDGVPFTSPASVAPSPNNTDGSPLLLRERGLPLRLINFEEPSPFGSFENLPVDVIHVLLERLTYSQIGNLSATSRDWWMKIDLYVNSASFTKKWIKEMEEFDCSTEKYTDKDPFYGIGVFLRKFTVIEKTFEDRLGTFQQYLKVAQSQSLEGCGRMIHGFMKDHASITSKQYSDFFQMAFNVFENLRSQIEDILDVVDETYRQPGAREFSLPRMKHEIVVRNAIKSLFLSNHNIDPVTIPNQYFLSFLVHTFKMKGTNKQSKLLYLLYAPTMKIGQHEIIHWRRFSEMVVTSREEASEAMGPMANALQALMECKRWSSDRPWTKNTVFNLMEEMTTYPEPWSMNTFVSLLLLQPCLIPISIVARMHKEHQEEAGDMLCTMKLLLHCWGVKIEPHLGSQFRYIKSCLTPNQCRLLYDSTWMWHQRNIHALRERYDTFDDITAEYQSQLNMMPLLQKLVANRV